MHDKIVAGAVTAIVVVPLCAVCIVGPALVGTALAGLTGWIGGLGPVPTAGLAIATGILVLVIVHRRRTRVAPRDQNLAAPPGGGEGRSRLPRLEPK